MIEGLKPRAQNIAGSLLGAISDPTPEQFASDPAYMAQMQRAQFGDRPIALQSPVLQSPEMMGIPAPSPEVADMLREKMQAAPLGLLGKDLAKDIAARREFRQQQQEPEKKGFLSGLKNFVSDPAAMAQMAIAFNSMRLNPDQGLAQSMQNVIERQGLMRGANATADYLRSKGREDLADLVLQNPNDAAEYLKTYEDSRKTDVPDSYLALHLRALAAGLTPGTEEYQKFMAQGGRTPIVLEQKIDAYRRINPDASFEEALAAVNSQTMFDQVTGQAYLFNPFTSEFKRLNAQGDTEEQPTVVVQDTEINPSQILTDFRAGTGIWNKAKAFWNMTGGQVGFPQIESVIRSGADLSQLERDVVNIYSKSARPNLFEQQKVQALIPSVGDIKQSPNNAEIQLAEFFEAITQNYQIDKSDLNDPRLPKSEKADLYTRVKAYERLLQKHLNPELYAQITGSTNAQTNPFEGMSDAELDAYIKSLQSSEQRQPEPTQVN